MSENPFADLIPKSAGSDNPFADLIPEAPAEAPEKSFVQNVANEPLWAADAALSAGTGVMSFLAGKGAGFLAGLASTPRGDEEAAAMAKWTEDFVNQYGAWQPRTAAGKQAVEAASKYVMEPFFGAAREAFETPAHDIVTNPLLMAATGGKSAEYEKFAKWVLGTAGEFAIPSALHRGVAGVRAVKPAEAKMAGEAMAQREAQYATLQKLSTEQREALHRENLQRDMGVTPEQAQDIIETEKRQAYTEAEQEGARREAYDEREREAVGEIPDLPPEEKPILEPGPDGTKQATIPGASEKETFGLVPDKAEHGGALPDKGKPIGEQQEIPKTRRQTAEDELVRQDPLYSLMADVKSKGGISLGHLYKDYGAETVRMITKKYPGLVQKGGKFKLDELADEHGFESADALMNKILDAPTLKEARKKAKEDFLNSPMGQQMELAKKGFTPAPKEGVVAGDLRKGDQVLIDGERFKVQNENAKGKVILKDGETKAVDMFDRLNAEGIKRRGGEAKPITVKETAGQLDLFTKEKELPPSLVGTIPNAPVVRTKQIADYKTHTDTIQHSRDAAEIGSANGSELAKESLVAIIVDRDGKIQSVHQHSVGGKGESLADAGELAGLLLNAKPGSNMYLVHNHPSGIPKLSQADRNSFNAVNNLLETSGRRVIDMIATTPEKYGTMKEADLPLQKPDMGQTVPVLTRVYADRGMSPKIKSVEGARDFADVVLPGKSGFIILDSGNRTCAVVGVKDMSTLKGQPTIEILQAIDKTNGTGIVAIGREKLKGADIENIQKFANNANLHIVDVLHGDKLKTSESMNGNIQGGRFPAVSERAIDFHANPIAPAVGWIGKQLKKVLDSKTLAEKMPGAVKGSGETLAHLLTRTVQDKFIAVKEWEKTLGDIPKKLSAYFTEERMHGRIAETIENFQRGYVDPWVRKFAEVQKKYGTTLDELDLYLKAKYHPTRKELILKRNPELAKTGETGTGMSDAAAAQIIADVKSRPGLEQAFEDMAKTIYDIQDMKLKIIEKFGLETKEVIADMKAQHGPYYVPLKGKEGVFSGGGGGSSFNVRSSGLRAAVGRLTPSENSIVHTFDDFEATVRRAHHNEVTRSFLNLVEQYNPKGIEVNKVQLKQRYNPETGIVETYNSPVWGPEENVISCIRVKKSDAKLKQERAAKQGQLIEKEQKPVREEESEHVFIRINDNPLLLRALKGDTIGGFGMMDQVAAKVIGPITRFTASLCTKWSPEFAITNQLRDLGDALQGLSSEHKATIAKTALKHVPGSVRQMYHYFRGDKVDVYTREFVSNGGTVGFYSQKDYATRVRNLENNIRREAASGIKGLTSRSAKEAFDLIGDVTGAGENGTRLAVYRALREHGYSVEDAVSYAKNVTVNFNRHGEHRWISQLYMFANPGIQGIKRFKDIATTKKGAKILGGITATALAITEANRMIAGEDEDGINYYDKLSPWEKSRNLILMNPANGKPLIKIPLGFYARLPFAVANGVSDIAHGTKAPGDIGMDILGTALDAFNPLGSGGFGQSLTPTVAKPFVEVATNQNAFGQPIYPEQGFGAQKPDSQRYFRGVTPVSKGIAEGVNYATGGDKWIPGGVDVSPESIDHVVKFFTGGPGKNIQQLIKLSANFYESGGDFPTFWESTTAQDIPMVGRVTGARTEYYEQQKFSEVTRKAEQQAARLKGMKKEDHPDLEKTYEEYGETGWVGKQATKYKNRLADMNRDMDAIKADNTYSQAEKRELLKEYEKEKNALMKEYIKAYNEAERERKQRRKTDLEPTAFKTQPSI